MLRARYPLTVALLAATLVIPAASASAADPVTSGISTITTGGSSGSTTGDTSGSTTGGSSGSTTGGSSDSSTSGSSDSSTTGSSGSSASDLGGSSSTNPLAGTPLEGLGATLTDPSSIPTDLQTFGSCLQSAGSDTTAGQKCFEDFLGAIGLPNTNCFSDNGFTLAQAQAKIEQALTGGQSELTPEAFQQNFNDLATQLQDLVTCLTSTSPTEQPASTEQPAAVDTTPPPATSGEAPAAVAVTGNPDFTG